MAWSVCGRYVVKTPIKTIAKMHRVFDAPLFEPMYNVAPTQTVPIVRAKDGGRELALARWGLIPSWAKDVKTGYRLINARADTVASKPSFRSAFKRRRCLVPADGFYEWQKAGKGKQPFYIHRKDEEPFAFAGLWEVWENPEDGKEVQSCSLITTEANELMAPIHDRMPVILPASAYDRWLDADEPVGDLQSLLKPYPADEMAAYPISAYVNNPRNPGAEVHPASVTLRRACFALLATAFPRPTAPRPQESTSNALMPPDSGSVMVKALT
jgi:putative SOS response-associated peptidase YedK